MLVKNSHLKRLSFTFILLCVMLMSYGQNKKYGIESYYAPEWKVEHWFDAEGNEMVQPLTLKDYEGKVVFILGFQSWCPGCHSRGFPTLEKVVNAYKGNEQVAFVAMQTVFEGHHTNTPKKARKTQQKYDIPIPFGHDEGDKSTHNRSHILTNYRTGGTPWIIIINQEGVVVFNGFHIDPQKAIDLIQKLLKNNFNV